ncbi:hypothetical protein ACFW5X_32770 [Streptomyces albogriseolus]|uniref:hypothetical protein n=1 Tax=Streptomyces albogriseolus TaxID=1887 RepID=UPI0036ABFB59
MRAAAPGAVTVLFTTALDAHETDETASLLAPVVNGARAAGEPLRLAMSGAACAASGTEPPARRLSEHLALDVVAPSGPAVVVPGGSLFTPDTARTDDDGEPAGWWRFSPGRQARYLGLRLPAPVWEPALTRLRADLADGHVLRPVPAGLLLCPADAPAGADGLAHAVPPDPQGPVLVVGVPGGRPVDAEAVETVVAALPRRVRDSLLLVPGDGRDLVLTAQEAAAALGIPLRAGNGLPVFLDGAVPADVPSTILVDAHGEPSWQPYVTSVLCDPGDGPGARARALSWRLPGGWETPDSTASGVLRLGRWQATATRAGLWVGKLDWQAEAPAARAPESDVVALELGIKGRALDDSLWPELELLFDVLDEEVRDRAIVRIHGNVGADGMRTLRRLTVRHGLALAARGPRAVLYAADVSGEAGSPSSPAGSDPSGAPREPEAPAVPAAARAGEPAWTEEAGTEEAGTEEADTAGAPAAGNAPVSAPPPGPVRVATTSGGGLTDHPAAAGRHEDTGSRTTTVTAASSATDDADGPSAASPGQGDEDAAPAGVPEPAPVAPAQPGPPAPGTVHGEGEAIRVVTDVPVTPAHRSEPADRRGIRPLLAADWEALAAMVQRALTHLPGLRTSHDLEGLRTDLIAVSGYLTASGGAMEDDALRARLRHQDAAVAALLGCIASGLSHLPCHRGAALRTAGLLSEDYALLPGEEVGEAVPVRAAAVGAAYGTLTEDHYLLWSATGRRTDALVPGGDGPGQVLFAPGTRFRVLDTVPRGGAKSVLLRELAPHEDVGVPGRLTDADRRILDRLMAVAEAPPTRNDEAADAPRGALGVFAEGAFTALPA